MTIRVCVGRMDCAKGIDVPEGTTVEEAFRLANMRVATDTEMYRDLDNNVFRGDDEIIEGSSVFAVLRTKNA